MKRIADIPEEIAGRLDLPAETVAGVPKLTVTGRRRALIENHRGLLQYSRDCIEVDGGRVRLRIRGANLQLVAMDRSDLLISGVILSAEFEDSEQAEESTPEADTVVDAEGVAEEQEAEADPAAADDEKMND